MNTKVLVAQSTNLSSIAADAADLLKKGEVVVVDQNFGVRITKIVLPEKRV